MPSMPLYQQIITCVFKTIQTSDEGSPSTKGEVSPAVSTSDDVIGPEMAAIEKVVKHLGLDSWQVENTQQVNVVTSCV